MVFRRAGDDEREEIADEDEDGLNIVSGDDDEDGDEESIFQAGDMCWLCQKEPGLIGLDPTCHAVYAGDADRVLVGAKCVEARLLELYQQNEGIAVIVEPFGRNNFHLYYRVDEMPAYQFPREDIEGISWILLTIGGPCARCQEQSHFAWLTPAFVDPDLPEDPEQPVFRNLDGDFENLCRACAAKELAQVYLNLGLSLLTAEVPRSAMGVLMPSGA